jgi:dihydrofolate reductase
MRKSIVVEFLTLDGIIQAPGAPDEDPSGGFCFGGWQAPYSGDIEGAAIMALYKEPFELLLGRRTYDIWVPYWPEVAARKPDHPIAGPFDRTTKHVATHHPETLTWKPSRALGEDIVEGVRQLKAQDGPNLITHGSGEMVRQLLAAGLVDELHLYIYPLVLGKGKRLFGGDAMPSEFDLVESSTTDKGVIITRYRRGGEVKTGTFEE